MSEKTVAAGIEQAVKAYIRACNDGDAETIAACFCSEVVHYRMAMTTSRLLKI